MADIILEFEMFESLMLISNIVLAFFAIGFLIYCHITYTKFIAEDKQISAYTDYIKDNMPEQSQYENTGEEKKKRYNQEIDLCNDFIRNNPKNLYAISHRAFLYSATNRYDEAINDCKYLIKKQPKNYNYVVDCAEIYARMNKQETAIYLINNFYKNKKRNAEYYSALGRIFEILKDYELAIKNFNEAIKLNPHNSMYYFYRAHIYQEIGDNSKYQQDMDKYNEIISTPIEKRIK